MDETFFQQNNQMTLLKRKILNQNKKNLKFYKIPSNSLDSNIFKINPNDINKFLKNRDNTSNFKNNSMLGNIDKKKNIDFMHFKSSLYYPNTFRNKNKSIEIKSNSLNNLNINKINIKGDHYHNAQQKNNYLPKIKIKKNINYKSIDEEMNTIKEKRSLSQRDYLISNYKKQKIIKQMTLNNNLNETFPEEILDIDFPNYKPAKHSENSYDTIISYAANTYQGIYREYNEDRVTIIINPLIQKDDKEYQKIINNYKISYFAIYDGHAGNKCCNYLKHYLHKYIFESEFFPLNPIKAIEEGFNICEKDFMNLVFSNNKLSDISGSCAIVILILNEFCYVANLGDSRALYSINDGKNFFQITRDHKPIDPIEKSRIYKAGGSIYKSKPKSNCNYISLGDNLLVRMAKLPYRVYPGNLAVSLLLNI